jgi:hypothetical protein
MTANVVHGAAAGKRRLEFEPERSGLTGDYPCRRAAMSGIICGSASAARAASHEFLRIPGEAEQPVRLMANTDRVIAFARIG